MAAVVTQVFEERGAFERVDVAKFVIHLIAGAGLDENALASGIDEQGIHRHGDAIARISGNCLLPHRLGYHAEHGAAIQCESSCFYDVKFEIAELQRVAPIPARARISFTAAYGSFLRAATSAASALNSASFMCAPTTLSIRRVSSRRSSHSFQCAISRL